MTQHQTATNPKAKTTTKTKKWGLRTQYTNPAGKVLFLTEIELKTAKQIEKLFADGTLTSNVSPTALNTFFMQREILELQGYDKWFAKQYYKSYILDFAKFKKDKDDLKRRTQEHR